MRAGKLYCCTRKAYRLPSHVDEDGKVHTKRADNIPFLRWPDGRWCMPANVFLLHLYGRGLSRRDGGGTLATYAAGLSHLIRFCFHHGTSPAHLTNDQFTRFIKNLSRERHPADPSQPARTPNRVIDIGRITIEFLHHHGRMLSIDLIGAGARITAERRQATYNGYTSGGKRTKITKNFWHHSAFPTPDPLRKRSPISSNFVEALRAAAVTGSRSAHQRKRRLVMLKLLEITGGRRGEVTRLTTQSVRDAAGMAEPLLRMVTLKTRREEERFVPIHSHDLRLLVEYLEFSRAALLRKLKAKDGGIFLVGETTGQGLRPDTIRSELALLSLHAGIRERSCPHMFRHRFITKLFVALIESHRIANSDEFRRALLDTEAMKRKILQWTGQKSLGSLDRYIDLAFDEVSKFGVTYSVASARRSVESFVATIDETLQQLTHLSKTRESPSILLANFSDKLRAFRDELTSSQGDPAPL